MATLSKVCLFFEKENFTLKNRTGLKKFIRLIFNTERKKLEFLNYVFVSDKQILKINQQYLCHDYYTDVITFDLSDNNTIQGEIYISADRVKNNALKFKTSFKHELHRVMFHGALHLCGYDDKTIKGARSIREKENFYLSLYF